MDEREREHQDGDDGEEDRGHRELAAAQLDEDVLAHDEPDGADERAQRLAGGRGRRRRARRVRGRLVRHLSHDGIGRGRILARGERRQVVGQARSARQVRDQAAAAQDDRGVQETGDPRRVVRRQEHDGPSLSQGVEPCHERARRSPRRGR